MTHISLGAALSWAVYNMDFQLLTFKKYVSAL